MDPLKTGCNLIRRDDCIGHRYHHIGRVIPQKTSPVVVFLSLAGLVVIAKVVYAVSEEEFVNYTCVITGDADVDFTIENIIMKFDGTKELLQPIWVEQARSVITPA